MDRKKLIGEVRKRKERIILRLMKDKRWRRKRREA